MPVEDMAEIGLKFENGTLASLHLDYDQRPPSHTLEIVGVRGSLRWDNADGVVHLSQVGMDGKAGEWQHFPPPEGFERNWMFLEELRHFINVLHGKTTSVCNLQDGIIALRLALAARQEQFVQFTNPTGS
jgi:predicted dehydrogenase